jgi:hypothetical protein
VFGEPLVRFELYPCYLIAHSESVPTSLPANGELTQVAASPSLAAADITGAGAATGAGSAERLRCRRLASPLFYEGGCHVLLNTSNVKSQFGKLFEREVDGDLYAQPLIATNVDIPAKGKRNVVYLATANNSVYAYDADDPAASSPFMADSIMLNDDQIALISGLIVRANTVATTVTIAPSANGRFLRDGRSACAVALQSSERRRHLTVSRWAAY